MYKRILVPIDGSETAKLGLNEAIKLAKNQGGSIRIFHVVNELIVVSQYASAATLGQLIDFLRSAGESLLNDAKSVARSAGVEVDTVLVEAMGSQAGAHIVQQAQEWPAELIVCGTHGRRGIRRIVMGSDAEYVVRYTPVPVLLVRSREPINE